MNAYMQQLKWMNVYLYSLFNQTSPTLSWPSCCFFVPAGPYLTPACVFSPHPHTPVTPLVSWDVQEQCRPELSSAERFIPSSSRLWGNLPMTGCGGQELLFLDITFPTLTLRVPPPPSSLGTLLFHWPFGGSAHDCTLPFLEGVEFQGFLVRILTKPYPAIPHIPPCLYCSVDFRPSGIRPWRSPWREGWGFTVRTMGCHWTYATRRLSSPVLLAFNFLPFPKTCRLLPVRFIKTGTQPQ